MFPWMDYFLSACVLQNSFQYNDTLTRKLNIRTVTKNIRIAPRKYAKSIKSGKHQHKTLLVKQVLTILELKISSKDVCSRLTLLQRNGCLEKLWKITVRTKTAKVPVKQRMFSVTLHTDVVRFLINLQVIGL